MFFEKDFAPTFIPKCKTLSFSYFLKAQLLLHPGMVCVFGKVSLSLFICYTLCRSALTREHMVTDTPMSPIPSLEWFGATLLLMVLEQFFSLLPRQINNKHN